MDSVRGGLRPVEGVRCLGCGKEYAKPVGRGTLSTNPGCPGCGYVGWLPSPPLLTAGSRPGRFDEDRRQLRSLRSG